MVYCTTMFLTHRERRNAAQRAIRRLLGGMCRIRRSLLLLAVTFVLGGVIGPAAAQPPHRTKDGVPAAEYIATRFGDVLLHAPTRYVGSSASTRKWMAERPRLGFSFWMPDRRPTEKALYGQPPLPATGRGAAAATARRPHRRRHADTGRPQRPHLHLAGTDAS